jgi:uncharacterized membrane protein YecN with MAPEG domain
MDYETVFYVVGSVLAASAVLFAVAALKSERFPGRAAPLVAVYFIALVGATTTFAVLQSQHEEEQREQEAGIPAATGEAEIEEAE